MPTPDALEALLSRLSSADSPPPTDWGIACWLRAAASESRARGEELEALAHERSPHFDAAYRAEQAAGCRKMRAVFLESARRWLEMAHATEPRELEHPDCAGCAYEGEARS